MFKIGQKVVCVDDSPVRADCQPHMPLRLVRGEVYTIREVQTEPHIEGYGVRLEELMNPSVIFASGECEWSYASERFRPIAQAEKSLLREAVQI